MNKKASKHPQVTICEIQCPRCGEVYYVTEADEDSIEDSSDMYECDACGFEDELSEWPWQEYTKGRLAFSSGTLVLEEDDW